MQFVSERLDSWQVHLEDISCYLVQGEGEWWKATDNGVEFFDTDNQPCVRPAQQHYRMSGLLDIKAMKSEAWQTITDSNIRLPTASIKIYDAQGHFLAHKTYM